MKSRISTIGLIIAVMGFVMMFGNLVSYCEPNSMIQTLQTRVCNLINMMLFLTSNILSYVLFIIGFVMFISNWIAKKVEDVRK
ncbi:MAG: hypothetical protein J4F36_14080 [Nitrosopumilaceae archaeon]|nr:hypothetical protein [Nitrosopumilaceae archaeon]